MSSYHRTIIIFGFIRHYCLLRSPFQVSLYPKPERQIESSEVLPRATNETIRDELAQLQKNPPSTVRYFNKL